MTEIILTILLTLTVIILGTESRKKAVFKTIAYIVAKDAAMPTLSIL